MKIHFIGIGGVSMNALAELARSRGHIVTGSDLSYGGHDPKNVDGCELVVYTSAVNEDNCELARARRLGVPAVERAVYLGEISRLYGKTIAVAGCHGKSTAAAMLGAAISGATVHVGVSGGSRVGGTGCIITEACEYKRSFLALSPDIGAILNIGYDHPDCYSGMDDTLDAYRAFGSRCKKLIVNGDDDAARSLGDITFGLGENNVYRAVNVEVDGGRRSFTVLYRGRALARLSLSAVGAHNVYNALAALSAVHEAGYDLRAAVRGINEFTGVARRFERKGIAFGKTVVSDYAHHPDEIKATIAVAREIFPSVAIVFQPHTYSRTKALAKEFAEALEKADSVILAPIFPAREKDALGVSSETILSAVSPKNKSKFVLARSLDDATALARDMSEKVVIFMGAGDIDKAADVFCAKCLETRA